MTLEDERGIVNAIVPKRVYERHRAAVRTAVMVRARGRLERREGVTNVLASEVLELERTEPRRQPTSPRRLRQQAVAELHAVTPAGHMFGRRG
jgi:DNA polymerase III alpha subunit